MVEQKEHQSMTQEILAESNVTRFGDFFKVLADKLSIKGNSNVWFLFGVFCKHHLLSKNSVVIFWATFETFGISGHTGCKPFSSFISAAAL